MLLLVLCCHCRLLHCYSLLPQRNAAAVADTSVSYCPPLPSLSQQSCTPRFYSNTEAPFASPATQQLHPFLLPQHSCTLYRYRSTAAPFTVDATQQLNPSLPPLNTAVVVQPSRVCSVTNHRDNHRQRDDDAARRRLTSYVRLSCSSLSTCNSPGTPSIVTSSADIVHQAPVVHKIHWVGGGKRPKADQ